MHRRQLILASALILLPAAVFGQSAEPRLLAGEHVRVQSTALSDGWHEGTLRITGGCHLIEGMRRDPQLGLRVVLGHARTMTRLEVWRDLEWRPVDLTALRKRDDCVPMLRE
jgi:hypothetical protein